MNIHQPQLAPNYEALVASHPDPNEQLIHIEDHATAIEGNFQGIQVHLAPHHDQTIRDHIDTARDHYQEALDAGRP